MAASALNASAGLPRGAHAAPLLRLRSDEQLVALFRAGNEEAFRAIHDRYRSRLLSYTTRLLGASRADAEDALQDVFVRAHAALAADDRPVRLRPWLYRVARNRCIDQVRHAGSAPAGVDVLEVTRQPAADPCAVAERRDELRRLVADLHALPDQQRSALLLRELEGLSHAELASALGVSVPAVKSLLVRARVGLHEAGRARGTACAEIREALSSAHGRGVRPSSLARRHVRECESCRLFRSDLRRRDRRLAALLPAPLAAPLTTLANLLGLGGAGGAATGGAVAVTTAVGTGAAGTTGTVAAGSLATATATKIAAVVATAAAVGGGAAEVHRQVAHAPSPAPVTRVAAAPAPAQPPAAVGSLVFSASDPGRRHGHLPLSVAGLSFPEAAAGVQERDRAAASGGHPAHADEPVAGAGAGLPAAGAFTPLERDAATAGAGGVSAPDDLADPEAAAPGDLATGPAAAPGAAPTETATAAAPSAQVTGPAAGAGSSPDPATATAATSAPPETHQASVAAATARSGGAAAPTTGG